MNLLQTEKIDFSNKIIERTQRETAYTVAFGSRFDNSISDIISKSPVRRVPVTPQQAIQCIIFDNVKNKGKSTYYL